MRKYIEASQGMVYTDGAIFGKKILIAEGIDVNAFYEITEEEYNAIVNDEEATEADYQDALRELGVEV